MFMTSRVWAALAAAVLLAGCAGNIAFNRGEKYALEGDWDRAVMEYRQALRDDPENISYKTRLTKATSQATNVHLERANYYMDQKNAEGALYEARQAQTLWPDNERARQLIDDALKLKELQASFAIGQSYLAAGRPNEALEQFQKVLDIDPKYPGAQGYIDQILKQKAEEGETGDIELSLASEQPVTLSFKEKKLKEVFEFLAKLAGINILFDEDVKDDAVTVFAKDVSFKQALNLLLATKKLFMKKIAADTIIIIPKTKSKQDQYQDLMIRTFYLSHINAKDMVNKIRTMLETRKIDINETLNCITMRDTPDKIRLAEKLIEVNDRRDSEVIIDVELLDVTKTDTYNLGITLPTGVTGTYVPPGIPAASLGAAVSGTAVPSTVTTTFGQIAQSGPKGLAGALKNNIFFAYPSIAADWQEIRSKAETLENPQIRTINNKEASILIGQRVPVQTGTVVSGTGGAATSTFEYRDVGIKLTLKPNIGLFGDVQMDVNLEDSNLNGSLKVGGVDEPKFITTTAKATLSLKDGETVIIGGLTENTRQQTRSGVAGLMDVPVIGKILSNTTDASNPDTKHELVMTMTPHVIRAIGVPGGDATAFWSGTEEGYDTKPLFETKKEKLSQPSTEEEAEQTAVTTGPHPTGPTREEAAQPAPAPAKPQAVPAPAKPGAPAVEKPVVKPPAKPAAETTQAKLKPGEAVPPPTPKPIPTPRRIGRVGTVAFAPEVMPVEVGQEVTIDVTAEDLDTLFEAPLSIIYNPKLVDFVKAEEGDYLKADKKPTSFKVTSDDKIGLIDVFLTRLGKVPGISGTGKLFSLKFKGKAPGISPLVFKQNTMTDAERQPVRADMRTGTLYVK